jgi:general secretion pathway protein E
VNCSHCVEMHTPTAEEALALGIPPDQLEAHKVRRGAGCLHCRQTGYAGRDGVFQVMPISERLRGLIAKQTNSVKLLEAAREEGMRTLREAAIEKVHQGITTVAEMVRVTSA